MLLGARARVLQFLKHGWVSVALLLIFSLELPALAQSPFTREALAERAGDFSVCASPLRRTLAWHDIRRAPCLSAAAQWGLESAEIGTGWSTLLASVFFSAQVPGLAFGRTCTPRALCLNICGHAYFRHLQDGRVDPSPRFLNSKARRRRSVPAALGKMVGKFLSPFFSVLIEGTYYEIGLAAIPIEQWIIQAVVQPACLWCIRLALPGAHTGGISRLNSESYFGNSSPMLFGPWSISLSRSSF